MIESRFLEVEHRDNAGSAAEQVGGSEVIVDELRRRKRLMSPRETV